MAKAYLSLGSNLGDKKENLDNAILLLNSHPSIKVMKSSSFYETAPVGYTNQDYFLNVVLEIETSLAPYNLLEYCNEIEQDLKRKRVIHWGPRTIDVDILLYEGFQSGDEKLTIPHPRMLERAFVMIPLFEIAPDLVINNMQIKDLVQNLSPNQDDIKILKTTH